MASRHEIQMTQMLQELAANFFARESAPNALVTVTRAELSPDLKNVTVLFTVLPESHEREALVFAKRARSDFREYVKKHSFFHPVPTIDFEIDYGEKNRQRIDDLTRK